MVRRVFGSLSLNMRRIIIKNNKDTISLYLRQVTARPWQTFQSVNWSGQYNHLLLSFLHHSGLISDEKLNQLTPHLGLLLNRNNEVEMLHFNFKSGSKQKLLLSLGSTIDPSDNHGLDNSFLK